MLNWIGRDRGPASALEQAVLPATTSDDRRTWTMAWYNAAIDGGHAVGALGAALPTCSSRTLVLRDAVGHALHVRAVRLAGHALHCSRTPCCSPGEAQVATRPRPISGDADRSAALVASFVADRDLFAIDSVGGGFLARRWWLLVLRALRHLGGAAGVACSSPRALLNVVSHLAAAWLAKTDRVDQHDGVHASAVERVHDARPGGAEREPGCAFFLAREALVEMDVPTRQSYVMAVVPPSARTYASGMTNVTRNAGWAVGPLIGGTVMQHLSLAAPLFIGGSLKIG